MVQIDKAYPSGPELYGLAFVIEDIFLIVTLPFAVFGILTRIRKTRAARIALVILLVAVSALWWWVGQSTVTSKADTDRQAANRDELYAQEGEIVKTVTSMNTCATLKFRWTTCIAKTFQQHSDLATCLAQAKEQDFGAGSRQTPRVKCYSQSAFLQNSSSACDALTKKDEHGGCVDNFEYAKKHGSIN